MEITKREVIASVSILAILLIIGFVISGFVADAENDAISRYRKALKINNDPKVFEYAMSTNVGDAFVYGSYEADEPVTYDDLDTSYLYVKRTKEEYTKHTRTVTETDSKGKTHTRTETYYTWDYAGSDEKESPTLTFLGHKFPTSKFSLGTENIDTVYKDSDTRYVYEGTPIKGEGTIFAVLKDNDIADKSVSFTNRNLDDTVQAYTSTSAVLIFWLFWSVIIFLCIYYFVYAENDWLNK